MTKSSVNDVGWMYHILPVQTYKPPHCYPQLSQIPELGIPFEECTDVRKAISNSKYDSVNRVSGRHDLLYHIENKRIKSEPVPYPRCEWFYMDDHIKEDYKKVECPKYKFKIPDYMMSLPEKDRSEPCVDRKTPPPPPPRREKKNIRKKLPDHRPGYAEYTRKPAKLTFATREYPVVSKLALAENDFDQEEISKRVLEHYYERDYDKSRRLWAQTRHYESLKNQELQRRRFKEYSKDYQRRKVQWQQMKNNVFPFA